MLIIKHNYYDMVGVLIGFSVNYRIKLRQFHSNFNIFRYKFNLILCAGI